MRRRAPPVHTRKRRVEHIEMVRNRLASQSASTGSRPAARALSHHPVQIRPAEKLLPSPARTIPRPRIAVRARRLVARRSASRRRRCEHRATSTPSAAPAVLDPQGLVFIAASHPEVPNVVGHRRVHAPDSDRPSTPIRGLPRPVKSTTTVRSHIAVALGLYWARPCALTLFVGRTPLAALARCFARTVAARPPRRLSRHHADARVGPHPQETWRIGAPAHAVVAGADCHESNIVTFGNSGSCDGGHHLRAGAWRMPSFSYLRPTMKPGDVLRKTSALPRLRARSS